MRTLVFDFDGTLTRRDTVHGFYRSLVSSRRRRAPSSAVLWGSVVAARLGLGDAGTVKRVGFDRFLRGRHRQELEDTGRSYVVGVPTHENVVARLDAALARGDRVLIVSASWDVYVRFFRPAAITLATPVRFEDDVAVGMGRHHLGQAKVEALREIGVERVDEAWSDSLVDRPLLRLAEAAFFVERSGDVRRMSAEELT